MTDVLIIEDDEVMREMLMDMMESEGLSSIGAENGNIAIELLAKTKFDLVITDLIMPEREGLETIFYLKQHHPSIPIIAISGGARLEPKSYLSVAKTFGVNYTFEKPIDRESFLIAVKTCLDIT
jgi:two-component system cell cycle response regulator CpdR